MKVFCYHCTEAVDLCDEVPNFPYCKCNGPCDVCRRCLFADPFYNHDGEE